jgi:hypothetical protein
VKPIPDTVTPPNLWQKWGTTVMAAGLVGSVLTIGAVIAYQANKPQHHPTKSVRGK